MPKKVWFMVVDEGTARLLDCSRVLPGRIQVNELEAIENRPEEPHRRAQINADQHRFFFFHVRIPTKSVAAVRIIP